MTLPPSFLLLKPGKRGSQPFPGFSRDPVLVRGVGSLACSAKAETAAAAVQTAEAGAPRPCPASARGGEARAAPQPRSASQAGRSQAGHPRRAVGGIPGFSTPRAVAWEPLNGTESGGSGMNKGNQLCQEDGDTELGSREPASVENEADPGNGRNSGAAASGPRARGGSFLPREHAGVCTDSSPAPRAAGPEPEPSAEQSANEPCLLFSHLFPGYFEGQCSDSAQTSDTPSNEFNHP